MKEAKELRPFSSRDPARWSEVERLTGEQKYEAASEEVGRILGAARSRNDSGEWTRALMEEVKLRLALHGYEKAVRFLREQPWPDHPLARLVLDLYYGHTLLDYMNAYSWEIGQREQVESSGAAGSKQPLEAMTRDQIFAEALRAHDEIWLARAALSGGDVAMAAEFVSPGNYPSHIRGTLRDAFAYLAVELVANTSFWRPQDSADVYRLDLRTLLAAGGPKAEKLADPSIHPAVKVAAILDDLEAWHASRGEKEAALEARLTRYRQLANVFTQSEDRKAIRDHLAALLAGKTSLEWWSMGQALLAELVRDHEGDLVRAREIALQGAKAHPSSHGARACRSIAASIEAPHFRLAAMTSDGLGKRSLQVEHKDVAALHFRAYPVDLVKWIAASKTYNLLPDHRAIQELLRRSKPGATWKVPLPATPDYQRHRTYVTPQLPAKGLWVILASAREDFAEAANQIEAVHFIATGLVVSSRAVPEAIEVTALEGESGRPAAGARVSLYAYDYQKGHREVRSVETGADGVALLEKPFRLRRGSESYFVLARRGEDLALDPQHQSFYGRERAPREHASFVYTDRSVYRPQQKIFFKVLAYRGPSSPLPSLPPGRGGAGRGDAKSAKAGARYEVAAGEKVAVSLHDANGQVVETRELRTNAFGSASGEITVPAGRLLGSWSLRSSLGGAAGIRVEEYKRPTFEVKLEAPAGEPRLNQPVSLDGQARYYFGLPVASGRVRWRVNREPVYPLWWSLYFWSRPRAEERIVATGTSRPGLDGTFRITFTPEADEREGREVSYRYEVTADLTDEGGETRSADRVIRLGFVAVEAAVQMADAFFLDREAAELTVMRTDLGGVGKPGKARFRTVKLRQPAEAVAPSEIPLPEPPGAKEVGRHRTPGDAMRPRHDPQYSPERTMALWGDGEQVAAGDLDHDAQGRARIALGKLAPGAYRLRYETKDEHGARFETFKDFIVAGSRTPLALPGVLLAQRSSVPVGGTARFLVHSGYRDQLLRLDVQKGGQRQEQRALDSGSASLVEIPVAEKDRGGFAVTLSLVRDYQPVTLQQSVFVPWDDKELAISFETFRDTLRPGQKETWRVKVRAKTTGKAEARTAEILAYMYDRSLDVFAPHFPPVPLSVYPSFHSALADRYNLGGAGAAARFGRDWYAIPAGPGLRGQSLLFHGGYGVGGPGMRGHRVYLSKDALRREAPTMPSPASPPMEAAAAAPASAEARGEADRTKPAAKEAAPGAELRTQFAETAFFLPHLVTDGQGTAAIEFTVPDSVTAYSVWVHAVTRDLRAGSIQREARAVKELMVRPYLPRFLREGDRAELKVVVNNASSRDLSGALSLEIFDPETKAPLGAEFGLEGGPPRSFTVKAGGGANLVFPLAAPRRVGLAAFRVVARSGDLSDGEQRALPVLPSRMHLAQSRFVTLRDKAKRTMVFEDLARGDDPTLVNERLVVTVDAQLFYTVLKALPYLVDYPYECTEQTLNRFVSTGIVSGIYRQFPAVAEMAKGFSKRGSQLETFDAPDPNRRMTLEESPWLEEAKGGPEQDERKLIRLLDPAVTGAQRDAALARLRKTQTSSGGWPWFPGGPPSPHMTIYLLYGMGRAAEFGVEVPADMTQRGWRYVADYVRESVFTVMEKHDCCHEVVTFVNYALTLHPDPSWHGGVFSPEERKRMLDFSFARWKEHSPMLKAYLALTLKRMGRPADGRLVFESVMDSAKTAEDQGTFWAPEDRSWLWYNDTIETHATALRALDELFPRHPKRDGLVLWLLLNKKLNHWKSTRATAEVIYSLAHAMKADGSLGAREEARVAVGDDRRTFVFEPDRYTGKTQVVYGPGQISPAKSSTITVEKETRGFLFASATWHFSTDKMPAEERGDFFSVKRTYFKREPDGQRFVLRPLAEGAVLEPGDELEVHLSLRAKHEAEYVHLRDPRGAGFEPDNAVSRYRFDLGIGWYEEYRDSGTSFFFERLPAGEYTFKYRVRANMGGVFRVGPAVVQSMYAPEFVAYSAGHLLRIGR